MSKTVPITKDFDNGLALGFATFDDDAYEKINKMLESGNVVEFAVGFLSKPKDLENGMYNNAELIEISMVVKPRK